MPQKKEKLMIIDGNALIHRSFHALPPTMTTKDGTVVNAVYGFASFLIKAMRDLKPEYVVLTLDKKGPTFRHEKFKEYKAKRVKAPDELYAQIPMVHDLAVAFNIPVFAMDGFEADDLIGTIVKITKNQETKTKYIENLIVTGDKDTLQLVDEHTKVYSMSRGVTDSVMYDEAAVAEKLGVKPTQVIDYKALRGDPSDNIPGVPGIGEKIAVELISNYNSLDEIYKKLEIGNWKLDGVKPRIAELLKEHKDNAYLSQELATIKCDVPLEFDLEATRFRDLDKDRVIKALTELEFKSLLPRVQAMFDEAMHETKAEKAERSEDKFARNQDQFEYILVDDEKKFVSFYKALSTQKRFTFDTETTGVDPLTCSLLGVSFSWEKGKAYFIEAGIKNPLSFARDRQESGAGQAQASLFGGAERRGDESRAGKWLKELKKIFEDGKIKKFAHNGKYDIRVLRAFGIEVKNFCFDTMIAAYLLNPGSRSLSLDNLTFSELGFEKISKKDLLGSGRDRKEFGQVETEKLSLYSCEDADYTNQLVKKLKPQLRAQNLERLFETIEMPLSEVLSRMEDNGVCLDANFLEAMSSDLAGKIGRLGKMIHKQAGREFNIKSTLQLKEVLFEKLDISTLNIKKTKTGFSTASDELDKLRDVHPIIRLIQEYRELTKLSSTYVDALPKMINSKTRRIHTSFNQTIAATGRLSSTDPNLQNIPIRTEMGREIRKAFVAPKGCKLLALDYSQIELRLAAHMSGDKKMIEAFRHGADIHTQTAAEINQVSPEAVDANMRREAKAVNFGILYGQGAHGLAQTADIPYARARDFIDNYFAVFSDVKKYIEAQIKNAQELGYVETLLGRRRYLPDINSSVVQVRKAAERMAMNTPLQGTAADMIKIAMIKIDELIGQEYSGGEKKENNKDATSPSTLLGTGRRGTVKMLLTVHDEVVLEVKEELVDEIAKKVKKIMEEVIKLKVPVVVDVRVGENWGEMEKLTVDN